MNIRAHIRAHIHVHVLMLILASIHISHVNLHSEKTKHRKQNPKHKNNQNEINNE